jgi:benzoate 4-monooxygenase
MKKLQAELDKVAEERREDDVHFLYEEVKNVEYLQACIDEALRIHSTSSLGLPRDVPAGGAEVCGRWFPEGTTLSVPVSLAATHVKSPMT